MATHSFDAAGFRVMFPEFSSATTYPDSTLSGYFSMSTQYVSPDDGTYLFGDTLQLALNLMTAHIAKALTLAAAGKSSGVTIGAGEGSVNVSLLPPPAKSAWQYWLSTTPYGMQLRALLLAAGAGGLIAGPSLERASFRKAGGYW